MKHPGHREIETGLSVSETLRQNNEIPQWQLLNCSHSFILPCQRLPISHIIQHECPIWLFCSALNMLNTHKVIFSSEKRSHCSDWFWTGDPCPASSILEFTSMVRFPSHLAYKVTILRKNRILTAPPSSPLLGTNIKNKLPDLLRYFLTFI